MPDSNEVSEITVCVKRGGFRAQHIDEKCRRNTRSTHKTVETWLSVLGRWGKGGCKEIQVTKKHKHKSHQQKPIKIMLKLNKQIERLLDKSAIKA